MNRNISVLVILCIYCTVIHAYRFYGPYDIFQPQDSRWQKIIRNNEDQDPKGVMFPSLTDRDEYLRQLIKILENIGKK